MESIHYPPHQYSIHFLPQISCGLKCIAITVTYLPIQLCGVFFLAGTHIQNFTDIENYISSTIKINESSCIGELQAKKEKKEIKRKKNIGLNLQPH